MDTKQFHISTGKELLAIKDRVRHLIPHWGEDGRYKEAVLKNVIQRFLPAKFEIATGFVVKQTAHRGQHLSTKQIDLLVYDTDFPILFKESDFVIVTPDAVRAIIEVKANLENQGLQKIIKKANQNGQFIYNGKTDLRFPFFNSIFSYEGFQMPNMETISNAINTADDTFKVDLNFSKFKVNHISFNKDWFFKYWEQNLPDPANYIYMIEDLSFSFFISNLMDFVSGQSVMLNSNMWFPVDKSIEVRERF